MAEVMAEVLAGRGDTALVFRGDDGLDELTTTTSSSVWVASGGEVATGRVDPSGLGIAAAAPDALRGADRVFNAQVARDVLAGKPGAVRDAVLLNAAAAIAAHDGLGADAGQPVSAAEAADRLPEVLATGLTSAREAIDSGAAAAVLDRWVDLSQQLRRKDAGRG
jgi:anthranilate phosphoribosyltransferase